MGISDDQILTTLGEMQVTLGKLEQAYTNLSRHVAKQNGRVGKSEARLSMLEQAAVTSLAVAAESRRVADQDRIDNDRVALQAARNTRARADRWKLVASGIAIPVGLVGLIGGVVKAIALLHI